MAIKELLARVDWKQVGGWALAVGTGIGATLSAISDQRKAAEFETLKKTVEDLKNN